MLHLDGIKETVFSFDGNKALGQDGFSFFFFQRFWNIILVDLLALLNDLYIDALDLERFNYAYITLIPKKEGALSMKDFRPISLLNSLYKIISTILSRGLTSFLLGLIDVSQSTFVKGRSIVECFLSAHEMLVFCKRSGEKGIIYKLDFEKAFDRLNWDFFV